MWCRGVISFCLLTIACGGASQRVADEQSGGASGSSSAGRGGAAGASGFGGSLAGTGSGAGGIAGSADDAGGAAGSANDGDDAGAGSGEGGSGGATGALAGAGGASGGVAGAASGAAGEAGAAGQSEVGPCNSRDGSGCAAGQICLDIESDGCTDNDHCDGYCAEAVSPTGCGAELAQCAGAVTCSESAIQCPEGFVNSIVNECWGPCVPADCCACASEQDCELEDVTCDLATGRCTVPAAPEPRCSLPVEPEYCQGSPAVFVFAHGVCQELAAGFCTPNDNHFYSLEECMRRCEGLPQQGECPPGRVARVICLACGPLGGCMERGTVCAETCATSDDCDFGSCWGDTCEMAFCI